MDAHIADAKDTKLKSPLEDLYDDFEDFDLGKTVERLRREIKTLRDHIKNQDNDIEKLADALVEMKTTNENLTKNISSLFMTSKTELERKDNIIADLRVQLDNFAFRRHGSNFQNSKRVIPQNKETTISGVVPNPRHKSPELPYNQKEDSVQNIKPKLSNVQHLNIERPGSSNRGNVFQERVRNNMHKWVKTEQLDLPLPSFADSTAERHTNQSARDNRYQDMHRNNNFEEPENQSYDKPNSYQDHTSRFETKPEYRRDRSTHRRKWEYDRYEDRRRDDTTDDFSKRNHDPRANDNLHSSYERSKSRNRELRDPRTDANSNYSYERSKFRNREPHVARTDDNWHYPYERSKSRNREPHVARTDNLHYSYERSKSRNRDSPVPRTDDNSLALHEPSKSSNTEPHVPKTDDNSHPSRERSKSSNREPHVSRTDDNWHYPYERSKSRNREPHVARTDNLHYSYERSKSRNRDSPVPRTDDNSLALHEPSKSSNREPHVPKTDDNSHPSRERSKSSNREPHVSRTDDNTHPSRERSKSINREPPFSRTDDNSHYLYERSKSSNRETHVPRTDDNSHRSRERSKSSNREPHVSRTDDNSHPSRERSKSSNREPHVPRTDDNSHRSRERSKSINREPSFSRTDDNSHYLYERSKSSNREPHVPRTDDNSHPSRERSKSSNRETHVPRTDDNSLYSYERSKSRNRDSPVPRTDDNSLVSRERSKSSNREPHVPRTDDNSHYSYERSKSRNRDSPVPRTDDNSLVSREPSKSSNTEPHVSRTDDNSHPSRERSKSINREPPFSRTDDNSHYSYEPSKSSNREPHVPRTDDNSYPSRERSKSINREPPFSRTDDNSHYWYETSKSSNREPHVPRTDDNWHYSRERSRSSNREPYEMDNRKATTYKYEDNEDNDERENEENDDQEKGRSEQERKDKYKENEDNKEKENEMDKKKERSGKYKDNKEIDEKEKNNKKETKCNYTENDGNNEKEQGMDQKKERKDKYKQNDESSEKEKNKKKEKKDNLDEKEKGKNKQKERKDNLNKEHDENDGNEKGMDKKKKRKDKCKQNEESDEKEKNKEKESKDNKENREKDEKENEMDKKKKRKDKCKQNEESDEKEKDKKKERKDNLDNKENCENDEKENEMDKQKERKDKRKKCEESGEKEKSKKKEKKKENKCKEEETESDNNCKNDFKQKLDSFLDSVMHKITVSNGNTEPTQQEEKYLDLESISGDDGCDVIEPKPELFKPPFNVTNSSKKIKKISDTIDAEEDARDVVNTNEINDVWKLDNGDEKVKSPKKKKSKGLEKSTKKKKDKLNEDEIFGCNSIDYFEQSGENELKGSEETLVGHCQKKNKQGAAEGAKTTKSEKRKKCGDAFLREIFGEDSSDTFNGDYATEPAEKLVQINANESKTKRNEKKDILQGEDDEMDNKKRRSKELSETATISDDSVVEKSKRNKKSKIKKSEIDETGKEYPVSTFDSTFPDDSVNSTETTQQTKKRKSKKSPESTVIAQDSFRHKSESKRNNKIKKSEIEEAAKMSSIISPFEDTLDEDNANIITETSKRTKKRKSKEFQESVATSDDNLVESTINEVKKSKLHRKSIIEEYADDFKEIPSVSAKDVDTTEVKYANFDQEHVGSSSDKETKFTGANLVENTNKYNNEESSLKEIVDFDLKDATQKLLVNVCDEMTEDTKRRKSDSKIVIVSNVMLTPGKQKCRKTIRNESDVEDEPLFELSQDLENIVPNQKDINMEKEMMEALSAIESCQFKEAEDASKTDFQNNMKASKSISRKNRLLERYASDEMKNQKSVSRHSEDNKFSDTAVISTTDSNNDELPIINDHEEIVKKEAIEDPVNLWKRKCSEDQKGPIQVNPPKKRKVDIKSLKSTEETNKESTSPIAADKTDKKPSKVMKEKDAAKVKQPKRRSERLSSKDSVAQKAELKKVEDKSRNKSESIGEDLGKDTENTYEANNEQPSGDVKRKEESTHIESVKSKNELRTNSSELNLKEDSITMEQKRRLSSEKIMSGANNTKIADKISFEPVENIETVPKPNNIDLEASKVEIEVSSANNRIEICNKQIVNKITDRHQVSIPTDGIEINVFSDEHKRIADENIHRLSPIIGGLYRNSLSPLISKTKSQQNPSISYNVSKDKTPPSPNLNKTPPSQTTVEKINGELPKARKRITPTPVKDAPVCSFKNILQNNNTIKLFSKNVAVQSHVPEEGNIPILHLEEINFSNFEESQKTYDTSIIKLLDCMNVSNLGSDMSKLCDNSNGLLRKENLTFENSVLDKVESSSRVIVDSVALDAVISSEIVTVVTPTEQDLPKIATSTPKVSEISTPPKIDQNINNGQIIVSDDIISTLNDGDKKLSCNEAAGSPISDKLSSSSTVTAPARFRRRCRMIAVKRE